MADRAFVGRNLVHRGSTNLADEVLVSLLIDGLGDFFIKPGSPPLNFHEDITMLLLRLPGKSGKGDCILDSFRGGRSGYASGIPRYVRECRVVGPWNEKGYDEASPLQFIGDPTMDVSGAAVHGVL